MAPVYMFYGKTTESYEGLFVIASGALFANDCGI